MATSTTKTSLEAIPLLKGRQNYASWSKQMESHLKASKAWKIIDGKSKRPSQPSHVVAPLRPQNLIDEHRERHRQQEEARTDDDEATPVHAGVSDLTDDNEVTTPGVHEADQPAFSGTMPPWQPGETRTAQDRDPGAPDDPDPKRTHHGTDAGASAEAEGSSRHTGSPGERPTIHPTTPKQFG